MNGQMHNDVSQLNNTEKLMKANTFNQEKSIAYTIISTDTCTQHVIVVICLTLVILQNI